MIRTSAVAIASAVAGALAFASAAHARYTGPLKFKSRGVSKAGRNDCANAAKTRSCPGQPEVDHGLGEYTAVADTAACDKFARRQARQRQEHERQDIECCTTLMVEQPRPKPRSSRARSD